MLVRFTATGAEFESVRYFPAQFLHRLRPRRCSDFNSANLRALVSQRPLAVAPALNDTREFHDQSLTESFSKGDNNLDRTVDLSDFIEFREIFNNQGQEVAGVPEPSGMALAGLALLATIAVMKRKR